MQKILPYLWFDNNAKEAINFYIAVIPGSKILYEREYKNTGPDMNQNIYTVSYELAGREFAAMNAGPYFKFNPAVSLSIFCKSIEEADAIWEKLSEKAEVLMEYKEYPFSKKYGWLNDKFGLSWQVCVYGIEEMPKQKVAPHIMFTGKYNGKTEDAMNFYTNLFSNSKIDSIYRYEKNDGDTPGNINHAQFTIEDQVFTAMDSSLPHKFEISGAISFLIRCNDQKEIDKFYDAFANGGEEQQCGWVQDKYGVVWQVYYTKLDEYTSDKDQSRADKVTKAMLGMKKLNVSDLEKAYKGS